VADPRLSVVVVAGAKRRRARRVLEGLAVQTARGELEAIVIDLGPPGSPQLRVPETLSATVLARPDRSSLAAARAHGVRQARAGVVAFLEDHCYPSPGWAETLIEAHRGPWAAVGYAFANANPETYVGRASQITDYGLWTHPTAGGPARLLPGNNVSYRRDALLAFGDDLERLLVVDFNLQDALRRRGGLLYVEPRALVYHENFTDVSSIARANHAYCRLMAANRAGVAGWSSGRRIVYAAATPVGAPLLKLGRLARSLRGRRSLVTAAVGALPVIVATHAWAGIGEARGYLERGPKSAETDFTRWELDATRAG
jgi:hypothetical protein